MNVLEKLKSFYDHFVDKEIIGYSFKGKPIYSFRVKYTEKPCILAVYSVHAREYITSYLAFEMIADFIKNGKVGTCFFIPCLNPDGVEICINGNGLYKANGRGVDLNVNFDADWGSGKTNKRERGDSDYIGEYPFSEKETQALRDYTFKVKPDMTLSYHSKGEEIYFEYGQTGERYRRDLRIARIISKKTGYPIKSTFGSTGGYKDWCVDKLSIPAVTIEICPDSLAHPIGEKYLYTAKKNFGLLNELTEKFYDR